MNLETKRNAIMNAIASGKIPNIVANNLTWNRGYYNQSGGITGANTGSSKEMYESEYIDIDITDRYFLIINMPNSTNYWCGIPQYQDDETFVSRMTPQIVLGDDVGVNSNVTFTRPKIRISIRTYGEANIGLYKWSDINTYLGDKTEVIWE